MKIRTVLAGIVVTGGLIAGVGYAAYYTLMRQDSPVEVVPVRYVNIDFGYYYDEDAMYGTVTSQVSQTVAVEDGYSIDEIYVSEGDEVTEGTPLFSYDMTLQEIQLDTQEISLQTYELQLKKYQKDLEKYQKMTATASLEATASTRTASASDGTDVDLAAGGGTDTAAEASVEGQESNTGTAATGSKEAGTTQPQAAQAAESAKETSAAQTADEARATEATKESVENQVTDDSGESGESQGTAASGENGGTRETADLEENGETQGKENSGETGGSQGTEEFGEARETEGTKTDRETQGTDAAQESDETGETAEQTAIRESVAKYESLMTALGELLDAYSDDLTSEDIGEELLKAVGFYRKNLAKEIKEETVGEDGKKVTVKNYELKESVKELLTKEEIKTLESCANLMERFHAFYVDLLIREAGSRSDGELRSTVKAARRAYTELSGKAMEKVKLLDALEELEAVLEEESERGAAEDETETEISGMTEDEAETEISGMTEDEAETETSGMTEDEAETETLEMTEDGTETETQNEMEVSEMTEDEAENEMTDETETESESLSETESEIESESEMESEQETEAEIEIESETELETETESEVESEIPEVDVAVAIPTFLAMSDSVLAESEQFGSDDYLAAITFYQTYLAELPKETEDTKAWMEEYGLKEEVSAWLSELDGDGAMTRLELTEAYQSLCLAYVRSVVFALDGESLTREELSEAQAVYDRLGSAWALLLEDEEPSAADYLAAYDVALRIQEVDARSEAVRADLEILYFDYRSLTDIQTELIWNTDVLEELLERYDLPEEETEADFYYWDDFYGGYSGDSGLTAAEIKEQIAELQTEIRMCELSICETELNLAKTQRIVDNKVVKSTLDGTVVSIGDENGESEDGYFVKVSSSVGLYAKGVISELALDTVKVGDVISGVTDYGDTFTAVIKEISEYPDPDGSNYVYSGNTNSSYYPFYALIDDPDGIEEGYAELTLSNAYADNGDSICLEPYFVRSDSAGNNYVYVQGDDGTLEMRYVTTGKTIYDYYIEVAEGLELSDLIAFPYGENVFEGAATKKVDYLEAHGADRRMAFGSGGMEVV